MCIENKAFYQGIRTNILDNINVEIESNKITYIGGASGSGKSSLAFQTIADISSCELDMLQSKMSKSYIFDLDSYENIQMMIPLRQLNFNVNPKSSIMTYFGLKKNIELLINNLLLSLDKPPIQFSIFNYCSKQNSILYKDGICNYKINYKYRTGKRHKTSKFLAIANEFNHSIFNLDYENYSKIITCDECSGSRFNKALISTNLFDDITIKNILLMPFDTLLGTIEKIKNLPIGIGSAVASLKRYIDMCCRLGLGHLNLSRGIINLSGGELQRLRLAKVLSGSLSGITLVLDEPTSSLHPDEINELSKLLSTFKRFNTLIIVEHNSLLADISDNRYYLSRVEGANKSILISKECYENQQFYSLTSRFFTVSSFKPVVLYSNYVEYIGKINIPIQSLMGICGSSGCGKSTILKTILPDYFEDYIYVSQKPIRGNINSSIGSYTGLLEDIKKLYIKYTGLEKKDFQSLKCKKCQGKGVVDITNYYETPIRVCCDSCDGTGYNSKFDEYKIKSINFRTMLMMNFESLFKIFYKELSNKSKKVLSLLCDIGLGYLSLGRRINTLSGGENQRLKLVSALTKNINIIGLDEPCQGLDNLAIKRFIEFIYKDIDKHKRTYIVAEHNPLFLKYTSYIVELSRISDKTIISYSGETKGIYDCADSRMAKWL